MKDFNRKVEDASARVNKSVAEAADRMEKETAEFITYLNDEVVPAVRQHSTKALRVAADKMSMLADYLDEVKSDRGRERRLPTWILAVVLAALTLSGCGGKKQAKVSTPPPPPMAVPSATTVPSPAPPTPKRAEAITQSIRRARKQETVGRDARCTLDSGGNQTSFRRNR